MTSKVDLEINQGSDYSVFFVIRDSAGTVDLTGYKAAMQLRKQVSSQEADDTLSTENGRLEIFQTEGKVKVNFTNQVTSGYSSTSYKYDLEIVSPGGFVTRVVEGKIKISPEVTRVNYQSNGNNA